MIVKFETAKLAKEKGFDVATSFLYKEDGAKTKGGSNDTSGWRPRTLNWNSEHFPSVRNGFLQYSAPRQSVLQKWLRDKYKIYLNITYDLYTYDIEILHPAIASGPNEYYTKLDPGKISDNTAILKYEEALEKGLIEALKLIENE